MNVSEVQHINPVYFIVFPPIKTNSYEVIDWPYVWLWNPGFIPKNLKSRYRLKSGIQVPLEESTIQNPLRGIQKLGSDS